MIRLTLILAAVIVAVLVIVPHEAAERADGADAAGTEPGRPARPDLSDSALRETGDGGLVLVTAEGRELTIDLVIEPATLTAEDAAVNLPPAEAYGGLAPVLTDDGTPPDGEALTTEADVSPDTAPDTASDPGPAAAGGQRLRVTGDRVNFRAGPSTEDAILAALTQGTVVELIERVADGWAHLRVPETGLSGYMSEDFLEPVN